ncbi:hypothetical protein CHS0354_021465, partial [Potamilus streckersoni]
MTDGSPHLVLHNQCYHIIYQTRKNSREGAYIAVVSQFIDAMNNDRFIQIILLESLSQVMKNYTSWRFTDGTTTEEHSRTEDEM